MILKEVWKEFPLGYKAKYRYAISNFGRLVSFSDKIENGRFLKGGGKGSKLFAYNYIVDGQLITKFLYYHNLVAAFFLPGKKDNQNFVIHLDHNLKNNRVDNLKWATEKEYKDHIQKSPAMVNAKKKLDELNRKNGWVNLLFNIKRRKVVSPVRFFPGEDWKEVILPEPLQFRYAISNHGRLMSFTEKFSDGHVLKQGDIDGYKMFNYRAKKNGKIVFRHFFIRKLVAQYFLPPPDADQTFVLLLDRDRSNNRAENLKWATKKEMIEHSKKSPFVIKARREKKLSQQGHKLSATQVLLIKQKLFDPNRKTRYKIIAKQFGVSEMALHRIKTGENWGHIKVKGQENHIPKQVHLKREIKKKFPQKS